VITHDMEIAEWAPRQVRVRDGQIVDDSGPGSGCRLVPALKGASR
jgi:putative ABC transport system ATP-binding protein